MKQNTGKMFAGIFLKSLLIVTLLFGVGFLSYQTVMHFWKAPAADAVAIVEEQKETESITVASLDDVSKNLIFCFNEETGEISKILLEIFNCEKKKLYYITIPVRTQYTMSDSLYQKLILVYPAIPQIIKLSNIAKYFDKNTVYDYDVLIIEDLLTVDISYYTAIGQNLYETMFTTQVPVSGDRTVPKEVFSEDYITFLKTIQTAEELSKYIEDIYSKVQSNLSLLQKMNYFESYCKTPRSNIHFEILQGVDNNSAYTIDIALAVKQIENCMAGTANETE